MSAGFEVETSISSAIQENSSPALRLDSIEFSEFTGESREWNLTETAFDDVNLIVGKNASGKSRLLSVIAGLARMLSGDVPRLYISGRYQVKLSSATDRYHYTLSILDHMVAEESLKRNGKTLLKRGASGIGLIWAEQIKRRIKFEAPSDQLAARTRRDSIQHPYFEDLYQWAHALRHFQFGTAFGKDLLLSVMDLGGAPNNFRAEVRDSNQVSKLYTQAFQEFKAPFDKAILRDLALLGYECSDIGTDQVDTSIIPISGPPMLWLYLQEKDLKAKTVQINMSQGMFRALSLVIHLNYCVFRNTPRTILIDDIGEGLDFSRTQAFISLLIEKAIRHKLQLVMTSNDRFVMNGVPLKYWSVIKRDKSTVRLINRRNSKKVFDEFETLGLNNFDFFSTGFFEEGMQ